jgi:hypothetical protein
MTKYEIIIYWSVDDGAFIAEVPELSGCAAEGPNSAGGTGECRNRDSRMDRNRSGIGAAYT